MDNLWGPINEASWRATPVIVGRVATEADVKAGQAVFFVPSGSVPHQIDLPMCGIYREEETGRVIPIVVIQAEESREETILGVRPLKGGNMICTLRDVELVIEPDAKFFTT